MSLLHTPNPSFAAEAPACSIVLLHGVGMSPMLFADVADLLSSAGDCSASVFAPTRVGYGADGRSVSSFDELLADVAQLVAAVAPAVLVGVSGGATLAVAAAVAGLPGVEAVLAHEPLIGPLAPSLHTTVTASARRLADSSDACGPLGTDHEALAFVERLMGAEVWARLPHEAHAFAAAHSASIRREVPLFVGYAPTAAELRRSTVPITISTGARSAAPRHEAAEVLAGLGATTVTIAGAAHLVHCEQPAAFAEQAVRIARLADATRTARTAGSTAAARTSEIACNTTNPPDADDEGR